VPGSGQQVNMTCTSLAGATTCQNGNGYLPGVQEYVYKQVMSLGQLTCLDWEFEVGVFARNNAITTLLNPGSNMMSVKSTFDGFNGGINSSPVFNTAPYFIFYVGSNYKVDCSAIDYDGDSLAYKLVNPLGGAPGYSSQIQIPYYPPYSFTNPFASNSFSFNSITGEMSVFTDHSLVTVISVLVEEWRNGLLIGTIMRDYQVMVLSQAMNGSLPSISGVNGTNSQTIYACLGDTIDFNIITSDPDTWDSLELSATTSIPGSNLSWSNAAFPTGNFYWVPDTSDVNGEPRILQIMAIDQTCPMTNRVYKTFTIYVNNCDTADVWPGDTDNDFEVDVFDLVPLAIAMGAQGQARSNASLAWAGQPAPNWGPTLPNGLDYKHADCDGDGLVDTLDALAIGLNYGQLHSKVSNDNNYYDGIDVSRNSGVDLYMDSSFSVISGHTMMIPLYLGKFDAQANNILSLALSINYDAHLIEAGSIELITNGSWLGNQGEDLFVISKEASFNGKLDLGFARINGLGVDGSGPIGFLKFTPKNLEAEKANLSLNITEALLVDDNAHKIPLIIGSSNITVSSVVSVDENMASSISIYPNPVKDILYLSGIKGGEKISIYSSNGQQVYSGSLTGNSNTGINLSIIPKGIYHLQINDGDNSFYKKLIK
jgi:hypothetical protein